MSDPQYPQHIEDEFSIVTSLIGGCRKVGDEWILPEGKTLPSQEEIDAKREELQADYDSKQYQRDRASQYPSITDVVVALAEKEEGNDTAWQEITAQRAKVKADNPKPS